MSDIENMPTWPGADVVYVRLQKINTILCRRAYKAWYDTPKRKRGKSYTVPEDVEENIKAMDRGDEEACKAGVARHLHLVFEFEKA